MTRGAPLRFLATCVGGWVAVRVAMSTLQLAGAPLAAAPAMPAPAARVPADAPWPLAAGAAPVPEARPAPARGPRPPVVRRPADRAPDAPQDIRAERAIASDAPPRAAGPAADALSADATLAAVAPAPPADPSRRWSGSAWLFARGDGGSALAPGGQLGGGQAGARIAYALGGGFALAARVSVATQDSGTAEAAGGIDWRPLGAAVPLRLSVERRVALGPRARDAWAAYAAGGVYRVLPDALVLDGYAQAGVVGARRRDLFADGALRVGRRVGRDATHALTLGAGIWGAAQPGTARLDLGPRAALGVPLGHATGTLALEARLRVAGRARPGSGLALTLAADF